MCRQTAGGSPATAEAYGHKAWWQLPGGALGMDALTTKGYAGKRQVPTLEQQGLVEAAATDLEHFIGFKGLEPGNSRLERPKNRGLCAGKRQAAALEQRLTAGLGGSCLEGFGGL